MHRAAVATQLRGRLELAHAHRVVVGRRRWRRGIGVARLALARIDVGAPLERADHPASRKGCPESMLRLARVWSRLSDRSGESPRDVEVVGADLHDRAPAGQPERAEQRVVAPVAILPLGGATTPDRGDVVLKVAGELIEAPGERACQRALAPLADQRGGAPRSTLPPFTGAECEPAFGDCRTASLDRDHTRERARPVSRRGAASHDGHTLDLLERQRGEIHLAGGRIVQRHPVEQHEDFLRRAAADRDRRR